ncbi:MAG TPA: hypothetical protein VLD63_00415 [Anaerolineales bacterium]|nr:hypothetical protein [Anaerolineales bacterium]
MASSTESLVDQQAESPRGHKPPQGSQSPEARDRAINEAEDRVEKARSRLIDAAIAFCDGSISVGQLRAVRELLREQLSRLESLTRQAVSPFVQGKAPPAEAAPNKIPTAPLRPKPGTETLLQSTDVMPELAQMLTTLDQKLAKLEEDFHAGRVNNAQYRAIKKHYLDQRDVAIRLQQAHPESDRWKVVLEEGKTSFLLQLNEAVCRSFSLYDLQTRERLFAEGSVPRSAEEAMSLLRTFGQGQPSAPGRMMATQGEDGSALLLVPGNFTAALVVFSQDPPAWQVRAMRELHSNFEAANRAALTRGERRSLVFPDVHRYIRT